MYRLVCKLMLFLCAMAAAEKEHFMAEGDTKVVLAKKGDYKFQRAIKADCMFNNILF